VTMAPVDAFDAGEDLNHVRCGVYVLFVAGGNILGRLHELSNVVSTHEASWAIVCPYKSRSSHIIFYLTDMME
jgi:hypothetical protein